MGDPATVDGRPVAGGPAQPVAIMTPSGTASGGASAANQTTGNASLASIDAKTPALGATTAASSSPVTLATDGQFVTSTGSLTETAPATDTASSGLNGRLQRIAQRLTSLIALLPAALADAGGLKTEAIPRVAAAGDVHAPTSNTAAIVTFGADLTHKHVITGVAWSYSAVPTSGNIKVEDVAGTTVFSLDITTAGPGFVPFPTPKKGAAINTAMIITLAAGGSGVVGKANALNHWLET